MVLMSSAAVSGRASGVAPGGKAPDDGVVVGAGSTAPAGAGGEGGGGGAGAGAPAGASAFLSAPVRAPSCRVSPTASCSILAGSTTTSGSMPLAWIERPEG